MLCLNAEKIAAQSMPKTTTIGNTCQIPDTERVFFTLKNCNANKYANIFIHSDRKMKECLLRKLQMEIYSLQNRALK